MDEGLEVYLDDLAMCEGDPGKGPIRMHDCSGE